MVGHRLPPRLELISLRTWVQLLDSQAELLVNTPIPSKILMEALSMSSVLRESTVIKIVNAIMKAGLSHLELPGKLFNPTLIEKFALSISQYSEQLTLLKVYIHPRAIPFSALSLLSSGFIKMNKLTSLNISGALNDNLLCAIAEASPPLNTLDVSYSKEVTDKGIQNLFKKNSDEKDNESIYPNYIKTLKNINLWDTSVTTKSCVLILTLCSTLLTLSCQWTAEALILLHLKKSSPLSLTRILISDEVLSGRLLEALSTLCPKLHSLIIRRPKDPTIDPVEILNNIPHLRCLNIAQFTPSNFFRLKLCSSVNLISLNLFPLTSPTIDIKDLINDCPFLEDLTLEGVTLELKSDFDVEPPKHLKTLRLISPSVHASPLDPSIFFWILKDTSIKSLDIGCCRRFEETDWENLLDGAYIDFVSIFSNT